jgi:FAD:protein FMN transferase
MQVYSFQHDGVLGTSLDLQFVAASERDAARAESVALAEIERVRRIISTWDSSSELSHLVQRGRLEHPSPELVTVLQQYDRWHVASGEAYSARVGALTALWSAAAKAGHLPNAQAIATTVATIRTPAWRIDAVDGSITSLTSSIDVNSLGKGFIIERAVAAVQAAVPEVRGGLVNIGGDIHAWGEAPAGASAWRVGVADPRDHFDNALPLIRVALTDRAISSSGNYERGFDIAGTHYSHILDPRTGYPADAVPGVTVIANDNATANALATTLSVLGPVDGLRLLATVPGAEAIWITREGRLVRSPGFAAYEISSPVVTPARANLGATIDVDITPTIGNRHRPYIAMWVTDTTGAHVKTLAFWGDKPKYQREMTKWWGAFGSDHDLVDAVTRATRPVGKYTFEWDGTNQAGVAVKPGPYMFWLEGAFEDGPHSLKSVVVVCGTTPATGTIASAAAFAGGTVQCGPAKQ